MGIPNEAKVNGFRRPMRGRITGISLGTRVIHWSYHTNPVRSIGNRAVGAFQSLTNQTRKVLAHKPPEKSAHDAAAWSLSSVLP